jgi:predicted RNase H-like HicB family nuclease
MTTRVDAVNTAHFTYRVSLSAEDGEFVATCLELPSLSWLASTQVKALSGLRRLVDEGVADLTANGEEVPIPLAERHYSGVSTSASRPIYTANSPSSSRPPHEPQPLRHRPARARLIQAPERLIRPNLAAHQLAAAHPLARPARLLEPQQATRLLGADGVASLPLPELRLVPPCRAGLGSAAEGGKGIDPASSPRCVAAHPRKNARSSWFSCPSTVSSTRTLPPGSPNSSTQPW